MAKYYINYSETYSRGHEVEANSKEEAEKKLLEGISEGKYNSPEECVDSWCETERIFE